MNYLLSFIQGSSNELHVEIEPVIDKDAFIHITLYPEDVYFPEVCGIILNKLTIHLTQVSHLAQPLSSLLKWDGSKFERLSSQVMFFGHSLSLLYLSEQIVSELNVLETTGIEVYDASACTTALVIAPLILIICDNPRASELLGHLWSTALKYCRICMVS